MANPLDQFMERHKAMAVQERDDQQGELALPIIPDWVRESETKDYSPPVLVQEAEILLRRKGRSL